MENNKYIRGEIDRTELKTHAFFGPVVESLGVLSENLIYSSPLRTKMLLKHNICFLIFLISLLCIQKIGIKLWENSSVASLVSVLYSLHPRIFADAHYNSKDTIFMAIIVIAMYYLFQAMNKQKPLKWLLVSALFFGIATTIRLHGIFIVPIFILLLVLRKNKIQNVLYFSLGFLVSFYLFFPVYWESPIDAFINQFTYASKNPWPWGVFIFGENFPSNQIPWYYVPVSFIVTTPLLYLVLASLGLLTMYKNYRNMNYWMVFVLFWMPLLLIWTMKPVMYDGWRHFTYWFLPVVLISGYGIQNLIKRIKNYRWISIISYGFLGYLAINHIWYWKCEYVYFNEYVSVRKSSGLYIQDYWNVSSKQCIEKLTNLFPNKSVMVYSFTEAADFGKLMQAETVANKIIIEKNRDSAEIELEYKRSAYFPYQKNVIWNYTTACDTIARLVKITK